jgi:O-antigen/teichoic acid export membrane protein
MYLLLSIILSGILGYILLMMGPLVGGIVAFAIVVGCIFRGLYLLHDIHKRMLAPKKDKVQEVKDDYLKEKDNGSY